MRAGVVGLAVLVCAVAEARELSVTREVSVNPPVGQPIVRELIPLADGLLVIGDGFVAPAGPGRVITEIFVSRLDATGATVWQLAWGSPEAGPYGADATGAVLAPSGELLIAGQTVYDDPAKGFVLRISPAGEVLGLVDIPDPNTNVDDIAVTGERAHVAALQLVSFDLATPQTQTVTPLAGGETSNGDLVSFPTGDIYFGATTETTPSRDFTVVRVREGGQAQQVSIGGSSDDQFWALAMQADASRGYAVGRTLGIGDNEMSSDFPYVNPLQPFGGGADATLVAFADMQVVAATAWGGNALDSAYDVAVSPAGEVVVVGETESTDFPLMATIPGGDQGRAYASWFDGDLASVLASTRLGATMTQAQSVAFDVTGDAVIAGRSAASLDVIWIAEAASPFVTSGGNDWWLEVYVENAGFTVATVDAQISGGAWLPLQHQTWGSWAASYHAPAGSVVRFRASDGTATVISDDYEWPSGTPLPPGASAFAASFIDERGNDWWIETEVAANAQVAMVEAQVGSDPWVTLDLTSWGSYATSAHVPRGATVHFRAWSDDGDSVTSGAFAWPP